MIDRMSTYPIFSRGLGLDKVGDSVVGNAQIENAYCGFLEV